MKAQKRTISTIKIEATVTMKKGVLHTAAVDSFVNREVRRVVGIYKRERVYLPVKWDLIYDGTTSFRLAQKSPKRCKIKIRAV